MERIKEWLIVLSVFILAFFFAFGIWWVVRVEYELINIKNIEVRILETIQEKLGESGETGDGGL